jgi:hypothetical protein
MVAAVTLSWAVGGAAYGAATPAAPTAVAPAGAKARGGGLLLLGDSMMRIGIGPALKESLAAALDPPILLHAKSATGLSRPDAFDWTGELAKLLSQSRFALAVVSLGSNDGQDMPLAKRQVARFGTPEWRALYGARLDGFLAQLCAGVDRVVWLGLPPMRNAKLNARVTELNGVIEAATTKPGGCASFVPIASALADAHGRYTPFLKVQKRRVKIRENDGVHITASGGRIVAQDLLKRLAL